jgi:hypothetical protein
MTPSDYAEVALRTLMLALVVYPVVRFVVKPILRGLIRRDGKVSAWEKSAYRWVTRGVSPLLGYVVGRFPSLSDAVLGGGSLYPEWMPPSWVTICATVGGLFAVAAHHAVEAALPAAVARLLTGSSWEGAAPPPRYDETITTSEVGTVDE